MISTSSSKLNASVSGNSTVTLAFFYYGDVFSWINPLLLYACSPTVRSMLHQFVLERKRYNA